MSTSLLLGILLVPAAVVAVVVLLLRGGRPAPKDGEPSASGLGAVRGARVRAIACLGLALVVLVAGAVLDAAEPDLLGLPITLAPGLAAASALLGYALLPAPFVDSAGPVTASLTPRTAWSYGSRRAFAVPAAITVATLGLLAWAGVVADPDDQGRMRAITYSDGPLTSSAGPFPGSFYGVPLALVTVLLAASAYLALRRISATPTLPSRADAPVDRGWREASTRLVVHLTCAAQLGYLGGVAFFAGHAVSGAGRSVAANGGAAGGTGVLGTLLLVGGLALGVAGLVVAVLAVSQVRTLASIGAGSGPARPRATARG